MRLELLVKCEPVSNPAPPVTVYVAISPPDISKSTVYEVPPPLQVAVKFVIAIVEFSAIVALPPDVPAQPFHPKQQ